MAYIRKLCSGRYQVGWREPKRDEYGVALSGNYIQRTETFDDENQAVARKDEVETALEVGRFDPATQRQLSKRPLASIFRAALWGRMGPVLAGLRG